jgi:Predicted aminopeptidases
MKEKVLLLFCLSYLSITVQAQVNIDSIINSSEAKKIVEYLAADSLKGRFTGSAEIKTAAEYIAKEFQKAGAMPIAGLAGYFDPFKFYWSSNLVLGWNVVAALQGKTKPDEIIIYSAHYDHVGTLASDGNYSAIQYPPPLFSSQDKPDSIYNGANDDASGVAAVILLARYFAKLNNNERTIVFCTFAGEEEGLIGSTAMVNKIRADLVKAVVNIEMLGRKWKKNGHPYVTGPSYSNFLDLMNKNLGSIDVNKYGNDYFIKDPFEHDKLFMRSDNYSFATTGIPSHSIMLTAPDDKYYHSPNDEAKTLDFETMADVIKAIALATENFSKQSTGISRIHLNH